MATTPKIYPPYALRTMRNAALLWVLVRLAAGIVGGWNGPSIGVGVLIVATTTLLVWWDGRRFHEHLFHADLGTPAALTVTLVLAVVMPLESLAQLLLTGLIGADAAALLG